MKLPTAITAAMTLVASLAAANCDSKTRGVEQSPGRADQHDRAETAGAESLPDESQENRNSESPDLAPSDVEAPEKSQLREYTADLGATGDLVATITTSEGRIRCRLFEERAPITVANFVGLARGMKPWVHPDSGKLRTDRRFYDGLTFHRLIPGFLIQGGDPTGSGTGGPGYRIPDEFHESLSHDRPGILSMANRGPNTGGSQFFITLSAATHLDRRHTIFGECRDLDVVRALARLPADAQNRPEDPPTIESVRFERTTFGPPSTSGADVDSVGDGSREAGSADGG